MPRVCMLVVILALLMPSSALSQTAAILGTVTDSTGAVLPGVTVEASSPALIGGPRVSITDERGLYRIVELRPGTYTVTFTLPGFTVERREDVQLTTGFTATANAQLAVGAIEQQVLVTRQASQVDVVNNTVQTVLDQDLLDALPLGQSLGMIRSLTAGALANPRNQDVGGNQGEAAQGFSINGGRGGDFQQYRDGMLTNSLIAAGNWLSSQNPATTEEVVVTTGGFGATAQTGGGIINIVQREGGNTFSGVFTADFTHRNLQSSNLNDELRMRNATTDPEIRKRYDVGGGFGGPLIRDKLWFYQGLRYWTTSSYQPNNYYNATQGTMFYTPDLSRPAYDLSYYGESNTKLTWQATRAQKITATYVRERNCNCFFNIAAGTTAPEAAGSNLYSPAYRLQGTWTYPVTSRLLLWAGATHQFAKATRMTEGGGTEADRSIRELSTNFRYNAPGQALILPFSWGHQDNLQANQNFTVSYLGGSHLFKVGFTTMQGIQEKESRIADSLTYTFRNGVPQQITLWATPYAWKVRVDYFSLFVEDQWTIDRLTLNLGLRYDGIKGSAPAQSLPAGPYVPARDFPEMENTPDFSDLNPRLGFAYDIFGTGRTALKASLSRTVVFEAPGGLTQANNPINAMVVSANRNWTDANGDFIPQESELGPLSNSSFGQVVRNTNYSDDVIRGWHNREYSWQGSVSVQHELNANLSVDFAYFRTWFGNFTVTRNLAVDPSDYDPYCITAPVDSRLPGGGGNEICGLYDITPGVFGRVDNLVMPASVFGDQSEVYNGLAANVSGNYRGTLFRAGLSTGGTTSDSCFVVNTPQDLYQCRNAESWYARTQFKSSVVATLPWDLQASLVYQMLPSIPLLADYVVGNAQVAPSLGRNLAGGGNATRTIPLIQNNQEFSEGLNHQLDLRFSRNFRVGPSLEVQPTFAIFNALNAAPVLGTINTYGAAWQNVNALLASRVMKFGLQVSF